MSRTAALALLIAACSSSNAPPPPPTVPVDAAVDGITAIGSHDPNSRHLDEGGTGKVAPRQKPNRAARPIDIMLRTTPHGAEARVDGVLVGLTPTFWFGESDGREHEFTFTRRNYATGRYRFVPVQSGIIHAQLEPVAEGNPDAGIKPQLVPFFAPDASVFAPDAAVAPPETVLSPDAAQVDAAVTPTPPTGPGPQP
jgi:hypothetical protein